MYPNRSSAAWRHQQAIHARCFHPSGEWNEFPAAAGSIVARFEMMVVHAPDWPAVKMGEEQLSYRALNAAANQLAHALLAHLGAGSEPVAFVLEQGIQAIVALLGILKAGKFYVALEPTYPLIHLQAIVTNTEARLILANQSQWTLATSLRQAGQTLLQIEQIDPGLPTSNPAIEIPAEAIAYLVYTSGTTGTPKGVIETHRNVLHYTRLFSNLYHLCRHDRLAANGSNSFSGTPAKIFPALLNGATLMLLDVAVHGVNHLRQWLQEEAITHFIVVPSLFRQLVATLDEHTTFPQLRIVGTGGDRLLPTDVARYQRHFGPHCLFRTGLALSEIKLVTHYFMDQATVLPTTGVPVGYCVEGAEVLLVDETGAPVAPGAIGEIVVRSPYLSPGYWRQPELTAARFRPDPDNAGQRLYDTGDLGLLHPDGCLFHLGRKDQQVKIRGVRIETAEIERALWATGSFKDVLVTARPDAQGEASLVAYLVPTRTPVPTVTALRQQLATALPPALIPVAFVMLAALPLNANGKVAQHALPAPDQQRPYLATAYVAPRTPTETTLALIWQEVLGIAPVGVLDHFLDLGGNSLRAMQVHSRLHNHGLGEVPAAQLFRGATIAELALLITQQQATQLAPGALTEILAALEV